MSKKNIFRYVCICFLLFTFSTVLAKGKNMKLIYKNTNQVIIEFINNKPVFHDKFLEKEMNHDGIIIPPAMAKNFKDKKVVFPNDDLFQKAFSEIFIPMSMNNSDFEWKKN
jgi:hypothetical protein